MFPPSVSSPTNSRTIVAVVVTFAALVVLAALHMLSSEVAELRRLVVREEQIKEGDDLFRGTTSNTMSAISGEDDDPWKMGPAPRALPSIPLTEEEKKKDSRNFEKGYGGFGDARHVGGFTANDTQGQSSLLSEFLIKVINIKSLVDLGCGRGISTKWFLDHNVDTLCIEGSSDAIKHSLLPRDRVVEHDFYRGPYWPPKTYDFCWSVEFLEHVSRHMMHNYFPVFRQCAILFVTASLWGGYSHVEVHPDSQAYWWHSRFISQGFVHSPELTNLFRNQAKKGATPDMTGQHLWLTSEVYLNPKVGMLKKHAHLFGGPGCYHDGGWTVPCGGADALPQEYLPVWRGKARQQDREDPTSKIMTEGWNPNTKP